MVRLIDQFARVNLHLKNLGLYVDLYDNQFTLQYENLELFYCALW